MPKATKRSEKENKMGGHESPDDGSAASDDTAAATVWETYYSEKHQREYFYNSVDQRVSWFAPSVSSENNTNGKTLDQSSYGNYPMKPIQRSGDSSSSKKWWTLVFLVTALVTRQFILISFGLQDQEPVLKEAEPVEKVDPTPSPRPVRAAQRWRIPKIHHNISHVEQVPDLAPELPPSQVASDLQYQLSMSWELNDNMPNLMPTNVFASMGMYLKNDYFSNMNNTKMTETKTRKETKFSKFFVDYLNSDSFDE